MITLIAAVDINNVIGINHQLPWKLSTDLANFKKITQNHTLVFGRVTYESIKKPLSDRKIIVLTRHKQYTSSGVSVVNTKEEALSLVRNDTDIFIAGGAQIYKLFINEATQIRLTKIHREFIGDTYFPEISTKDWSVKYRTKIKVDPKSGLTYSVIVYQRNNHE